MTDTTKELNERYKHKKPHMVRLMHRKTHKIINVLPNEVRGYHAAGYVHFHHEEVDPLLEDFSLEEIENFMQTEEYEQLDEISKKTLGSYIKKAGRSVGDEASRYGAKSIQSMRAGSEGERKEIDTEKKAHLSKEMKRHAGIAQAVKRLTREDVDLIETKVEPSKPDKEAVDRKHRLDAALEKKRERESEKESGEKEEPKTKVHHGKYGTSFSEMVNAYNEKGLVAIAEMFITEEPDNEQFTAEVEQQKKKAAGTTKQACVSKPAVQAVEVQKEDTEELDEDIERLDEIGDTSKGRKKLQTYLKRKITQSVRNISSMDDKEKESAAKNIYRAREKLGQKLKNSISEDLDEELNESTDSHASHSEAMSAAHNYIKDKGYHISDDNWQQYVSGKRKPSEGDTNRYSIPLHKDGVETNKFAHIQVYNKGNHIPKNYELNVYVDSGKPKLKKESVEELDERTLTKSEIEEKERLVHGMKKNLAGFRERYGKRGKEVMYAVATKKAKEE